MKKDDFETEKQYREQLFKELIEIVEELGWNVAIPHVEEDDEVPGLIIGNPEYVEAVTEALEEYESFEK